jgi:hypothetical protein
MWVLENFIEELKTVKGQRNALFIALVVVLVIMFRSCSGDTDIEKFKYEQNIAALRDSVRTYETKNGDLVSEKTALITDKSELKKYNDELNKEIKHIKDNPIIIKQVSVEMIHDTIYAETIIDSNGIVFNKDSSVKVVPFRWDIDSTYSKGNFRRIGGKYIISIDTSMNVKSKDFVITHDELGLSFTTGITENKDDRVEIFIKSNYPNFKAVKIDGALFDPRESKVIKKFFPPKRWGVGVFAGYGMYIDSNNFRAGTGVTFGVGVSYDLLQWRGK